VFKIELETIYFDVNKSALRSDAIATIDKNISKLKGNNKIMVKITAHTDSRAAKDFNLKLSQKRAQSVIAYLGKRGIGKNRILAVANMGEDDQIFANCSGDKDCLEKLYQLNRRVEFKVIGVLPAPAPKQMKTTTKGTKKTSKKSK
jgi:peptidoglycan-associated lipoprotein